MLKDERLDKIMELLSLHKYLSVDFLVNHLHYSPATVRRDITKLEKIRMPLCRQQNRQTFILFHRHT